jgi:acetylornithine deacetylase/succinyl-diaminopimelate desuccinylase-like protein
MMMSSDAVAPAAVEQTIKELLIQPRVQDALRFFEVCAAGITEEQIAICSIPAPPFGEAARALYLREKFRALGLEDATIDTEGNCIAYRPGRTRTPLLVVSAHLDTVFPAGTDFRVRRAGSRLIAPGIADDGCGLAALIALARVFNECRIETEGSLLFVGTVGEEGEGDLRGVNHLLTKGEWAGKIDFFISFDGPGIERITHAGVASRRYRVMVRGAGGHSWGDFGAANPVHALGRTVARLAAYPTPHEPRTTFNVGRIIGGTSVNAIPHEASMDVDLRSAEGDELMRLDAFFRRAVRESIDDENAVRRANYSPLELELRLIGDRPGGVTAQTSQIVRLAEQATRALGIKPQLDRSSTDANLPISLGIPAITLGAGGASANSHTLDEWYDPKGRDIGLKRALLVMLALIGATH